MPRMDGQAGVSVILTNTAKGTKLLYAKETMDYDKACL